MPSGTLEASADAWIDEAEPTANNGTGQTLLVRSEDGADRRAPVQFDMDQLPADFLAFTDASLIVKVTVKEPDTTDRTIELWWYDASFGEETVTWDAQPGSEFPGPVGSDVADTAEGDLRYDVIGFIDQIPTSGAWPLFCRDETEDSQDLLAPFEVTLYSRETAHAPVFEFTYRAQNEADLDSQLMVLGSTTLPSDVTPRLARVEDVDAVVEPLFFEQVTGVIQVRAIPIDDDHDARARGRVSITLEGALDDVEGIFDEVASPVTVEGEEAEAVVQSVDEGDVDVPTHRPRDPARLRRGDARLFALGDGSTFVAGDVVTWQGLEFQVVGALDEEHVTDEALFRELGLRRLASKHEGRAIGTVSTT